MYHLFMATLPQLGGGWWVSHFIQGLIHLTQSRKVYEYECSLCFQFLTHSWR